MRAEHGTDAHPWEAVRFEAALGSELPVADRAGLTPLVPGRAQSLLLLAVGLGLLAGLQVAFGSGSFTASATFVAAVVAGGLFAWFLAVRYRRRLDRLDLWWWRRARLRGVLGAAGRSSALGFVGFGDDGVHAWDIRGRALVFLPWASVARVCLVAKEFSRYSGVIIETADGGRGTAYVADDSAGLLDRDTQRGVTIHRVRATGEPRAAAAEVRVLVSARAPRGPRPAVPLPVRMMAAIAGVTIAAFVPAFVLAVTLGRAYGAAGALAGLFLGLGVGAGLVKLGSDAFVRRRARVGLWFATGAVSGLLAPAEADHEPRDTRVVALTPEGVEVRATARRPVETVVPWSSIAVLELGRGGPIDRRRGRGPEPMAAGFRIVDRAGAAGSYEGPLSLGFYDALADLGAPLPDDATT